MRNTVPAVTALFWVTKLLTTAMGETASDYLVKTIDPVVAVGGAFLLFAAALVLQFAVRRYIPWVYWSAVLMVAVFGTMVADVLHVELGIPYLVSTVVFAVALATVFVVWYTTQRTLSVHRIDSRARQFFYWCAVLMTFALGTALGDLTAVTFGLGYFASALVFGILFAIPGIAYRWWGLGATAAFWSAYVLTRPFGASRLRRSRRVPRARWARAGHGPGEYRAAGGDRRVRRRPQPPRRPDGRRAVRGRLAGAVDVVRFVSAPLRTFAAARPPAHVPNCRSRSARGRERARAQKSPAFQAGLLLLSQPVCVCQTQRVSRTQCATRDSNPQPSDP